MFAQWSFPNCVKSCNTQSRETPPTRCDSAAHSSLSCAWSAVTISKRYHRTVTKNDAIIMDTYSLRQTLTSCHNWLMVRGKIINYRSFALIWTVAMETPIWNKTSPTKINQHYVFITNALIGSGRFVASSVIACGIMIGSDIAVYALLHAHARIICELSSNVFVKN